MHVDLIVRNALVGNALTSGIADVAVVDGKVVAVRRQLDATADREIDGTGKTLVPGGIDPHTHFDTPSPYGSLISADNYESGTRAAAAGGVTTIVNYAFQMEGESMGDALTREMTKAAGRSHVDFGFHPILTDRVGIYAGSVSCPVYFVHLSSRAAVEAVRQVRAEGAQVYTEVRPAYLFLEQSHYDRPNGNQYVCLPPLRTTDDQSALWDAMCAGEIQTSASDHTTYSAAQKMGPYDHFVDIPPGFASIQTGFGLLYSHGVAAGRLTLSQFVGLTSANSAKLFGLWPSKGQIAVGADADMVLIDPDRKMTLAQGIMESASDYDPFTGIEVTGWPETTIARGEIIYADGQIASSPGRGHWLFRDISIGDPSDPMTPTFD